MSYRTIPLSVLTSLAVSTTVLVRVPDHALAFLPYHTGFSRSCLSCELVVNREQKFNLISRALERGFRILCIVHACSQIISQVPFGRFALSILCMFAPLYGFCHSDSGVKSNAWANSGGGHGDRYVLLLLADARSIPICGDAHCASCISICFTPPGVSYNRFSRSFLSLSFSLRLSGPSNIYNCM